jgi:hypothetical protein
MHTPLIDAIQHRVAVIAIGPSTARGQGAAGVVRAAQRFLASLALAPFATSDSIAFRSALDEASEWLRTALPDEARSWGLARKCLNIFLRDSFYNHYLRQYFGLTSGEQWFEIPLDSIVAKAIRRQSDKRLPRWPGVKHVPREVSEVYQSAAAELAQRFGIARVHLDTYLWVQGRGGSDKPPEM